MDSIVFSVFYIIAVTSVLGGLVVAGEFLLRLAIRFSPRLRRFFDDLPMNRVE